MHKNGVQQLRFMYNVFRGHPRSGSAVLFFKLFPCVQQSVTLFLFEDDRSVRDSERRAAIMHFTSDQVLVITTIYYIDTSVLLENILLVKFIKTTSGTRVVYFP